jgi:hypothetical protein
MFHGCHHFTQYVESDSLEITSQKNHARLEEPFFYLRLKLISSQGHTAIRYGVKMAKLRVILGIIALIIFISVAVMLPSIIQTRPFTHNLVITQMGNVGSYIQPEYSFNLTDNGKLVGYFYFRMDYIFPNQTSNEVYVDFEHIGNTRIDSINFQFQSPEVTRLYTDMSDPVGIVYSPSRNINLYAVKATFGELGNLQGSDVYQFILYDDTSKPSYLYFSADISLHYMTPVQWTELKADISFHTQIPQA